jgi:hypothetical protein
MFSGHIIVGGSTTVIVNEHEAVPHEFVAVHVTVVVPTGKVEPDARSQETVVPTPVPVGVAKFTTAPLAEVAPVEIFVGQLIAGASPTETENEHEAWPAEFDAVQVTVVVPSAKLEPDAGVQLTVTPSPVAVGAA